MYSIHCIHNTQCIHMFLFESTVAISAPITVTCVPFSGKVQISLRAPSFFLLFSKASWFWAFPLLSTRFCFSHKYVIVCVWTIAIHATHDKIYVEMWPASVSQKCPCMTCVTYMSICGQSQRTWRHWCFPLPERPACSFHTLVAILVARVTAKYEEQWLSRTKSIQI